LTVRFYGCVVGQASGSTSYEPKNSSDIRQLIDELGDLYGKGFKDYLLGEGTCLFLVNGSGILLTGGLSTKLNQGDRIEILPFIQAG
jgi:molybdopterin converting factor small subunit